MKIDQPSTSNAIIIEQPEKGDNQPFKNKVMNENTSTKKLTSGCTVKYPVTLPKLSTELEGYVNNNLIFAKQSAFVKVWGTHLLNLTSNYPTSIDYVNYAKTICETFPVLSNSTGKENYVSDKVIFNAFH